MGKLTAAVLAGLVLGAVGGWIAQGWRADATLADLRRIHAEVLTGIATKTREAADAVHTAERQIGLALAAADSKHTKELADEKAETQRLRDCVRAGTCGVRIVTRYVDKSDSPGGADAATGSVGDAAVALDAAVSERVFDLRDSIAEDEAKLAYLRGYAEHCHKPVEVN